MTPQAIGKMPEIPALAIPFILVMRNSGMTISEIAGHLADDGAAFKAAIQNCCLQHFGKRDLRGPEIGHLPGKTKSFRRGMAQ